jgi:hypothetical protein
VPRAFRRLLLIVVTTTAFALAACGGDDEEPADTSGPTLSVLTDPSDPNFDEPEIPAGAALCSDVRAGDSFVAFRVIAAGVPCPEAEEVARSAAEGSPPSGWTCDEVQETLVECRNGESLVAFNSA